MQKEISPKIVALTFGVLVISFLAAFYVVAWQEPTQAPPGGNVPAPLNVGPTGQSKAGGLILNTGGAAIGLIIDKGQVCIGTDCRTSWPIAIPSGMIAMFDTSCPEGWTRFAALDGRVPYGSASYGATGGSASHTHTITREHWAPGAYSGGSSVDRVSLVTSAASSWPPYLTVIWCKKN